MRFGQTPSDYKFWTNNSFIQFIRNFPFLNLMKYAYYQPYSPSFSLWETLPCDWEVGGHCMCKERPVIPVNRVIGPLRIIRKNGGPRRRRGTRGRWPKKNLFTLFAVTSTIIFLSPNLIIFHLICFSIFAKLKKHEFRQKFNPKWFSHFP
jgi:hypothetical protein